jgi:hypothetical protein
VAVLGRFNVSPVKSQKLLCRSPGIPVDRRLSQFEPVTKQQPDLYVADNQSEESAKCLIRILKMKQSCVPSKLKQRLQAACHGKWTILKNDSAEIVFIAAGMANGNPIESDGNRA